MLIRTTFLFLLLALSPQANAQGTGYYQFLTRDNVGATSFNKKHPSWDGRRVVIAILDTGVVPSVPGLRTTTDGKLKVIDARDFSGQGDVRLKRARIETVGGVKVLQTSGGMVKGFEGLKLKPEKGEYWLGFFEEKSLLNSSVKDINKNGHTKDRYAVVAFKPTGGGHPVTVIDTDGDGSLAGEATRKSYKHQPSWFHFANKSPKHNQTPIAFTATVLMDKKTVELHFDDGAHGTHCAGISAGHGIHGKSGFDGIAPGAQVISLKIGNNALAGGATTPQSMRRAIAYASDWAKDHKVPVIISLSYGIGSGLEGVSDIDKVLDRALEDNPLLVASVAAGNSGPGISSVGTPAASARAWTAGALLTPANARTLWGATTKKDRIFFFSSRGGELDKPDGVSPGVAWATVPAFMTRSVMAGTSMATPQATGVHALLISAALAEGVAWNADLLKRALKATTKSVRGATRVDAGAGLIQVGPAYAMLKKIGNAKAAKLIAGWNVRTPVPSQPGNYGTASYWRTGHYLPGYPSQIRFDISPAFYKHATDAEKKGFFRQLKIRSNVSWLRPDRSTLGVREGRHASLRVTVKRDRVKKPGLHIGLITATPKGSDAPAFTMPVIIAMPHRFNTESTRVRRFGGSIVSGDIRRHYVEVPPGATSMALNLRTPSGKFGNTYLFVFNPEGHYVSRGVASSAKGTAYNRVISGEALKPGVWELVTYGNFRNEIPSRWSLSVAFDGIKIPKKTAYRIIEGRGLEAKIVATNRFETPFTGRISGQISGITRQRTLKMSGHKRTIPFRIGHDFAGVSFHLKTSPTDYNKFTDIALTIFDSKGKAVSRDGFGSPEAHIGFHGAPGSYRLEILGGTTLAKRPKWTVHVDQTHEYKQPINLSVRGQGGQSHLYPSVPLKLTLGTSRPPAQTPKGFSYQAALTFKDRRTKRKWLQQNLLLTR